jgi:hypothetical protein
VHVPTHFFKVVLLLRKPPAATKTAGAAITNSVTTSYPAATANSADINSSMRQLVVHGGSNSEGAKNPTGGTAQGVAVGAFLVSNSDLVDARVSS